MDRLTTNMKIMGLMFKEERRLNASMIGEAQFLMFPFMILLMSFVIGMASEQMLKSIPMENVYIILHSVILVYGLGVGGFALFGERMAERRIGEVSLLLETPRIHPVTFKEVLLAFYIKDTIYYMLYSIVPLVGGLALTIPFTGFRVASVLFLLLTLTLSFLTGISFSFLLSSLYVRWRAVFAGVVVVVFGLAVGGYLTGTFDITRFVPSMALQTTHDPVYALAATVLVLAFSYFAVSTLKITFSKRSERFEEEMIATVKRFSFAKGYSTLMAKDWMDLIRSGTLTPVLGAYVGPLAFLAVLFWFLGTVLTFPLHFNLIFFAAMIGFFGVSVYGWMNLLDAPAFLDVLPVSVPSMIRTKLRLFAILAGATSTVFLVALSILQSELEMLGVGLAVAYSTTLYTVTSTAYLTGLRTNSYLFDPRVLAKFASVVVPPLIALTILSFRFEEDPAVSTVTIVAICGALLAASVVLYRRIDPRWRGSTFAF